MLERGGEGEAREARGGTAECRPLFFPFRPLINMQMPDACAALGCQKIS